MHRRPVLRLSVLVLAVAGTAAAQPVTRPEHDPCNVTIAVAPAEVRAAIEAWVRAEPRCERELEVRVLPSDEGLYLQARSRDGRVRERVVPDAQSAAVLVVSWMADDSLGPTYPEERAALLVPPVRADELEIPLAISAPGLVDAAPRMHHNGARRWLSLGALAGRDGGGFRGQVDVLSRGRWYVGLAGGVRREHGEREGVAQARVVAGVSRSFGRFSLRGQLGLGANLAEPDRDHMEGGDEMEHRGGTPALEAGVLATVRIKRAWGLFGGPLFEASPHARPSVSMFLGVQRGL